MRGYGLDSSGSRWMQWQNLVKKVMNFVVSKNAQNFINSRGTASC